MLYLVPKPPERPPCKETEVYTLLGRAVTVLDELMSEAHTADNVLALSKALRLNLETREHIVENALSSALSRTPA